jgi:hypothetical protein
MQEYPISAQLAIAKKGAGHQALFGFPVDEPGDHLLSAIGQLDVLGPLLVSSSNHLIGCVEINGRSSRPFRLAPESRYSLLCGWLPEAGRAFSP